MFTTQKSLLLVKNHNHNPTYSCLCVFQFDEKRADMPLTEESKLDKGDVISFIHSNSMRLVIPFNEEVTLQTSLH